VEEQQVSYTIADRTSSVKIFLKVDKILK